MDRTPWQRRSAVLGLIVASGATGGPAVATLFASATIEGLRSLPVLAGLVAGGLGGASVALALAARWVWQDGAERDPGASRRDRRG